MTLLPALPEGKMTVSLSGLNLLDWVIGMTVALSVVSAFMRGLIRSVLSLAGLVLSVVLAAMYAGGFAAYLVRWVHTPVVAEFIAFTGIVLITFLTLSLLGHLVRQMAEAVGLGFFDRLGGAVFGALRAILLLAALALPLAPFVPRFAVTRESVLLPYLLQAAHGISFVLPRSL